MADFKVGDRVKGTTTRGHSQTGAVTAINRGKRGAFYVIENGGSFRASQLTPA